MKGEEMVKRKAQYPIDHLFIDRWSPRAMSGESLTDEEIMTLFEAARWAPSSYDGQPWRFIYAKRDTPQWDVMYDLMVDFNKQWAKGAGMLILVISRTTFEYNNKPDRTHSFTSGCAMQNLALQGYIKGLVVHGMEGFNYNRAREVYKIPDDYTIEAMYAVGKPGRVEDLPQEMQKREEPSDRKPVQELICEGAFCWK
jgi:nitroreductase